MSAAKHTPGPWETAATDDSLIVSGRTKIAATYEVDGDAWGAANARLIAAAPDLLEAALAVERLWDGDREAAAAAGLDFNEEQAWQSPVGVVWRQLRAAIAKATGQ